MPRAFPRAARVASLLKDELIAILRREVKDPRLASVAISDVEVKGDLDHAVVWLSLIGEARERRQAIKALEHAAPFLRRELGSRLRIRQVPTLGFQDDQRMEGEARVQELLDAWHQEAAPSGPLRGIEAMERIAQILREGQRFVLMTHLAPDGDSLGSALALQRTLVRMGKEPLVVSHDVLPERYRFLPGALAVGRTMPVIGAGPGLDAVLTFECPDISRTGWPDLARSYAVVNIDHHEDNALFGRINWVEPEAPAVGDMVVRLIRHLGQEIDADTATCLYTALMTDTGSFTYSNASAASLRLGAELVDLGADPYRIAMEVYDSNRSQRLRLLAVALASLQTEDGGRLAWLRVGHEDLARLDALPEDMDDLVNFPRSVRGVELAVIFKELEPGRFRVSLRSKGDVDVFRVARAFHGGGHRNAAGCSLDGTFEDVRDRVLQECRAVLEPERSATA